MAMHAYNCVVYIGDIILYPSYQFRKFERSGIPYRIRDIDRSKAGNCQADDRQESCSSAGNCQADEQTVITQLSRPRSEEHTSELQSPKDLVCRLLLEKKKKKSNRERKEWRGEAEEEHGSRRDGR